MNSIASFLTDTYYGSMPRRRHFHLQMFGTTGSWSLGHWRGKHAVEICRLLAKDRSEKCRGKTWKIRENRVSWNEDIRGPYHRIAKVEVPWDHPGTSQCVAGCAGHLLRAEHVMCSASWTGATWGVSKCWTGLSWTQGRWPTEDNFDTFFVFYSSHRTFPVRLILFFPSPVVDRVVLQTVWVCSEASGLPNCSLPNVALFHPLKSREQPLGFGRYWSEKADWILYAHLQVWQVANEGKKLKTLNLVASKNVPSRF
jgi:hypothetical protein